VSHTDPPRRTKVSGVLALVACAVCCALPFLIAAGVLTSAGAAVLERTLIAVAAGLAAVALGTWWLHRRGVARRAAAAAHDAGGGCDAGCCATGGGAVDLGLPSAGADA
jgi:hypothetical protein